MSGADGPASVSQFPVSETVKNESGLELKNFTERIVFLRPLSVAATILHILVSIVVLVMGFSQGPNTDEAMSPSVVTFGFGCLVTAVFAFTESYIVFAGTSRNSKLTTWRWHSDGFLRAVVTILFLVLFMLPAITVYILHSQGRDFFGLLRQQRTEDPNLFGLIIFHIISGIAVFLMDAYIILRLTKRLHEFHSSDEEDEEEKKKEEEQKTQQFEVWEVTTQEVPLRDFAIYVTSIIFYAVHTVDLCMVASRGLNSFTVGSAIVFGIMLLIWLGWLAKFRRLTTVDEDLLLNYRLATLFHVFLSLCIFWISLAILILLETNDKGFFETISILNDGQQLLCSLLIIFFLVCLATYGMILYVHSRSMWSLDEIQSLYLAAKIQKKMTGLEM